MMLSLERGDLDRPRGRLVRPGPSGVESSPARSGDDLDLRRSYTSMPSVDDPTKNSDQARKKHAEHKLHKHTPKA